MHVSNYCSSIFLQLCAVSLSWCLRRSDQWLTPTLNKNGRNDILQHKVQPHLKSEVLVQVACGHNLTPGLAWRSWQDTTHTHTPTRPSRLDTATTTSAMPLYKSLPLGCHDTKPSPDIAGCLRLHDSTTPPEVFLILQLQSTGLSHRRPRH